MILAALDALYDRLKDDASYKLPRAGFSLQKITFKVVLKPTGELLEIQDARQAIDDRLRPLQLEVLGETKPPGSGLNPCFLWDNASYMLGFEAGAEPSERTHLAFDAFRAKHLALESEIRNTAYSAVCRFLEAWQPESAQGHEVLEDAAVTGFGVFQIQATPAFVHEEPAIVEWWLNSERSSGAVDEAQCLVTGKVKPIARIHGKVRGVLGAQGAGAAIVGFNDDAYRSYGKDQSFNAPVSEAAAFRYVAALNALLDGPRREKHRLRLGDASVVFWTDRPSLTEDIFLEFATGSRPATQDETQDEGIRQKLEAFLAALRKAGEEPHPALGEDPDATTFYLLGLSPNAARLSIRFFYRGTVRELTGNLRRHHADIAVAPQRSSDSEFPPLWALLRQTARETKDIPPILAGPLLRSVITGAPYPEGLYSAVMRRIRADREIGYLRACVLKGYLSRNQQEDLTMSLDEERADAGYRLGRLFAALEKTQEDALGGNLNATIRDRFYSSASATPGAVFPRLMRTYQHHLSALEGGRKVVREKLIQTIVEPLREFPAHLNLSGQGLFAIGYYHQRLAFFTKSATPSDETPATEETH